MMTHPWIPAALIVLCLLGAAPVMGRPLDDGEGKQEKPAETFNAPSCNIIGRLTKVLSTKFTPNICNGTAVVDFDCSSGVDERVVNATRNMTEKLIATGNMAMVQCNFNYSDMPFGTCSVRMEVKKVETKDDNEECRLSSTIAAVACDTDEEISLIQRSVGQARTEKCSRYDQ